MYCYNGFITQWVTHTRTNKMSTFWAHILFSWCRNRLVSHLSPTCKSLKRILTLIRSFLTFIIMKQFLVNPPEQRWSFPGRLQRAADVFILWADQRWAIVTRVQTDSTCSQSGHRVVSHLPPATHDHTFPRRKVEPWGRAALCPQKKAFFKVNAQRVGLRMWVQHSSAQDVRCPVVLTLLSEPFRIYTGLMALGDQAVKAAKRTSREVPYSQRRVGSGPQPGGC